MSKTGTRLDLCKVCGKPSMVMNADYTKKVPFRKAKNAKSFTCGICVAYGALRRKVVVEDINDTSFCLTTWRKNMGLTQTDLAEVLMVSRVQVSKVESGNRIIPERWVNILEKMYPTHA